jgi:hypothetical protein
MTVTGETEVLGKNLSQCHFVNHRPRMEWPRYRTRASAVIGRQMSALGHCIAFSLHGENNIKFIKIQLR